MATATPTAAEDTGMIATLGLDRARPWKLFTPERSSWAPENAVTATGTSCSLSSRLRAVTMISPSSPPVSSDSMAGAAPPD